MVAALGLGLLLSPNTEAGTVMQEKAVQEPWDPFAKGIMEVETTAGGFWALNSEGNSHRPDVAWAHGSLRLGWMLNDPSGSGFFRGNFEFMVGLFGGWIYDGPGDGLGGADLILRYNFVQPNASVVPFFQIGAGGMYSDMASDDGVQHLLGSDFNFALQSALGLRFFISENCAITASAQYQHFSNGGASDRNNGIEGLGGLVGVSCFF
jgi:lipid A 3-O-deacylase